MPAKGGGNDKRTGIFIGEGHDDGLPIRKIVGKIALREGILREGTRFKIVKEFERFEGFERFDSHWELTF